MPTTTTPVPVVLSCPNPTDFLHHLLATVRHRTDEEHALIICSPLDTFRQEAAASNSAADLATISALSTAQNVAVTFCPSLLHLRAFLSTISPPSSPADGGGVLAVWGLVAAHRETAEFSAQGLGRTAAALVEAGLRSGRRVLVGERLEGEEGGEVLLPVLNSTVKVGSRLGEEIAGRTVGVGAVLGRWMVFERIGEA